MNSKWNTCQITRTLEIEKKISPMNFTSFTIFLMWDRIARDYEVINLRNSVKTSDPSFPIINLSSRKTLLKLLWPLSLPQSALKVEKSWNWWNSWHWLSWIVRLRVIFHMFHLQSMITAARPFDTILYSLYTTFYDLSNWCYLSSKAEIRQFGASRNQIIWGCREPTG